MVGLLMIFTFFVSVSSASEEQFDTDEIMSKLEKEVELSSEKLKQLKPQIDEKSAEVKKSIQESVDKGFLQMDELSEKLDAASKATEEKVKQFLNSEEYTKFKEFMTSIDKQAIEDAKTKLTGELADVLQLTEDQAQKIKPILEESIDDLNKLISKLKAEGLSTWNEFKSQYEELSANLRDQLQEMLDSGQLERLDKYNKEKKEKLHEGLFEV